MCTRRGAAYKRYLPRKPHHCLCLIHSSWCADKWLGRINCFTKSKNTVKKMSIQGSGKLRKLRPAALSFLLFACAINLAAAPFAYITNRAGDDMSVIDIATNTVVATVPPTSSNFNNYGVAVHPSGARVYITHNGTGNAVSILDTSTNTRTGFIVVNPEPLGIAINAAGTRGYVAHSTGTTVTVLDTIANIVVTTITVTANATGVAVTPDGSKVYVTHSPGNVVTVINATNNTVTTTIPVGIDPFGIAINPAGTRAYVAHGNTGDVRVIDTSTNTVIATVPGVTTLYNVAVSTDGSKVYISSASDGTVKILDAGTNMITGSINVGTDPQGIAVTPDGTRVYAVNQGSNNVSVINTGTNTVVATLPVGLGPRAFGLFIGGPATAPGAPTIGAATPGNNQATINFTPPASNGGSAITSYVATCTPGPVTGSNTASPITVTGLTNGTPYSCSVQAINAIGAGPASVTVGVTPVAPGAPAVSITGTTSFPATAVGNSSSVQAITITNSGTANLSISGITHSAASIYPDTTGGPAPNAAHYCGFGSAVGGAPLTGGPITITPASTCTLNLVFAPNVTGALPASITVNSNAPTSPTTISLTGFGAPPNVSIAPSSIAFGNIPVSLAVSQISTFNNPSAAPYTITALAQAGAGFSVAGSGASPCNVGAIVNGGASCTYTVTFTPTGPGSSNTTTTVTFQPFGTGPTYSAAQNAGGIGFTPPFTLSPSSLAFGNVTVGVPASQSFTFTNNSNTTSFPTTYTITSFGTTGLGFSAVGSGGTPCAVSLTLAPGASCGVTVTVVPAGPGSTNGTTTIGFLAGLGADPPYSAGVTLSANGVVVPPTLSISSNAFGAVVVGGSASVPVTLTSGSGASAMTFTSNNAQYTVANNTCGTVIAAALTCTFDIRYAPDSVSGSSAVITVGSLAGTIGAVSVSGNGVQPATSFAPTNHVHGAVTVAQPDVQAGTFTNNSPVAITISGTLTSTSAPFVAAPGGGIPCNPGAIVPPAGSCNYTSTYTPVALTGLGGNYVFSYTAGALSTPVFTSFVGFSGNGVAATMTLTPGGGLTFSNVVLGGTSANQLITLANTSPSNLNITSISVGANPALFPISGTCMVGSVIAPAGTCTIAVAYTPVVVGSNSDGVTVGTTQGATGNTFSLTANSVAPVITFSGVPMAFGNILAGSSATLIATVINSAIVPITIAGLTVSQPSFSSVAPGGGTPCTIALVLLPAASCTAAVTYSPPAVAGNAGFVNVNYTPGVLAVPLANSFSFSGNAIAATGPFAYITNDSANTVSVIDIPTNTVTATVAVGTNPLGVAVTPDGTRVYVTNVGSNSVSVINTVTNTVVTTVAVGSAPIGVAVTPDGSRAYVANNGTNVSVIGTATNTVIATVAMGGGPFGVAVSPAGTRVYVANEINNNVSVIDTATNSVIATVPVGVQPQGVAVTPDGARVYVANLGSNSVSVIGTATNSVIATVPVGSGPRGVAVTPDGTRVYVVNQASANVSVIDTATNTVTATVAVGTNPLGVAVTPDGTRVYVTNVGSNSVSVINTVTNTAVTTVAVGANPRAFGVFIQPAAISVTPPNITSTSPLGGTVGTPYTHTFTATGTAPITWVVTAGSVPAGLILNPGSGVLSGTPTAAAVSNFTIQAGNGVPTAATQIVALTISAAPSPAVTLSTGSLTYSGQTVGTSSGTQAVTITNSGTATLNFTLPFTTTGDFSVTTSCGVTLAPTAQCTAFVTFTPTVIGGSAGNLSIVSNAASSPNIVTLGGTGQAPTATYAPPAGLSFGSVVQGVTSTSQQVTFTNTSPGSLTLSGISFTGGAVGFAIVPTSQCLLTPTLGPGAGCTFDITATPNTLGTLSDSVRVTTIPANAATPANVLVVVNGVAPPSTISQTGLPAMAVVPGLAVNMNITVSGMAGTPTGIVTVKIRNLSTMVVTDINGGVCLMASLVAGAFACPFIAPGAGNYQIEVSYPGDGTYAASGTPTTFPLTTAQAVPTIAQTGSPAAAVPGQAVTMMLNLTSSSPLGPPTGIVTVKLRNLTTMVVTDISGGTCLMASLVSGAFTCPYITPAAGNYQVEVTYSGDAPNAPKLTAFLLTTAQAVPTITQTGSPATAVPGQPASMMINVTSSSPLGPPTGIVTVKLRNLTTMVVTDINGGTCLMASLASGAFTCPYTAPAAGNYAIEVSYSGDTPNASKLTSFAFTTAQAVPTIAQTGSPPSSVPGQSVSMMLTVSSSSPLGPPTGIVTVKLRDLTTMIVTDINGGTCLMASLASGSFTCPYTTPVVGNYQIEVSYSGDTPNAPKLTSFPLTITATPTPSMTVSFAPTSVVTGASASMTLTLTNPGASSAFISAGGIAIPAGLVATLPGSNTCGTFGSVTAGSYSFGMGFIPALGSCTIVLTVQSPTAATYTATIAPGALNAGAGTNTNSSSAALTVTALVVPTITFGTAPTTMTVGGTTIGTMTITNSNAVALTANPFTFFYLPGLVNAPTPNATSTCSGATWVGDV